MKALLFILVINFASCAQVKVPYFGKNEETNLLKGWRAHDSLDYTHHLASFEEIYLDSTTTEELKLLGKAKEYLENLALTILQNNELFFSEGTRPKLHIVKHPVPFHFSLPGRVVFLSTSLLNKYVKHEAVLASILSYELVRSEKQLYNRFLIVPVGYLPIERVLGLNRIDVDEKVEIHKWAYHSIRRAGFDGEYYLSWLQTMNRNTADFIPLIGDANSISREEAMFKAFMIRRSKTEDERAFARRESSKEFYHFLFFVKDKSV
jgi:hypothetical protein